MSGLLPKRSTKEQSLFDRLKLTRECPLCAHAYTSDDVRVLESGDNGHLVHMTCRNCQGAILAMVVASRLGMSTVGIVTDLDPVDVLRLRVVAPVSQDDVLNFHTSLEATRDWQQLLRQE